MTARAAGERLAPEVARLLALVPVGALAALAWARMLRPQEVAPFLAAVAAGVALGALVVLARRLPRRLVAPARAACAAALLPVALLLAGAPAGLVLDPRDWDELAVGIARGLEAMPRTTLPLRPVDEWARSVLVLGGVLPLLAAGPLAVWPRRRGVGLRATAVVAVAVAYGVPAVQVPGDGAYAEGALLAMALAGFLWLERIRLRDAPVAAGALLAATAAALLVAPRVDAERAWLEPEHLAQSLAGGPGTSFVWDHRYGPLDWPRDGRELLRVRADKASYWKVATLGAFDGVRWRQSPGSVGPVGMPAGAPPQWRRQVRVSVRGLTTRTFVGAGETLRVDGQRRAISDGMGGLRTVRRPLSRGDAYQATVYVPAPERRALAAAGTDYRTRIDEALSMRVPPAVGGPPEPGRGRPFVGTRLLGSTTVFFPPLGQRRPPVAYDVSGTGLLDAVDVLRESDYARTYALARRLASRADTPYDLVQRVARHLRRGFRYTERPRGGRVPLDAFLFRDRAGYCQQFSGAMALLLRMGGVPARVAGGFSPGARDGDEFVVRDLDAHSWVEVYFADIGWVAVDPTPSIAPARAQAPAVDPRPDAPGLSASSRGSERVTDPLAGGGAVARSEQGPPWRLLVAALASVALAAALARRLRRRTTASPDAAEELLRALRRTGRPAPPSTTLSALERRLGGAPQAQRYVRVLREQRYGFGSAGPTADQRRALRRELGAGLGAQGRLRAWWALPPRLR